MLYINFPKKGAAQTFLRGRSNAGFAGVWAGRELTFGQHLFSENWKVKIEREKGWKKECENAFCKMPCGKKKIRNWECKMPRENWKGKREYEMPWKKKFQVRRAQTKRYFQGRLNIASKPKIWVITDETFHLDLQDLHVLYNSYQWFPKPVSFFISTRFFELKWRRDLQGWQQVVNQLQSCLYSEIDDHFP